MHQKASKSASDCTSQEAEESYESPYWYNSELHGEKLGQVNFRVWCAKIYESNKFIIQLSSSTIKSIMKNTLKYSYKKADLVANHRYQLQNVMKLFKASLLLKRLVSSGKHVIFVDEFKINLRNTKFMKWSKVGTKGCLKSFKDNFSMAFSSSRLLLIQGFNKTVNSGYFLNFINKLCRILSNEFLEAES